MSGATAQYFGPRGWLSCSANSPPNALYHFSADFFPPRSSRNSLANKDSLEIDNKSVCFIILFPAYACHRHRRFRARHQQLRQIEASTTPTGLAPAVPHPAAQPSSRGHSNNTVRTSGDQRLELKFAHVPAHQAPNPTKPARCGGRPQRNQAARALSYKWLICKWARRYSLLLSNRFLYSTFRARTARCSPACTCTR